MAGTQNDSTVQLRAQCLCKAHTFHASVPYAALPLQASSCHCNSCRHVTGAMYSICAPWPKNALEPVRNSTLKKYPFSPRLTILFCGTCSSTLFVEMRLPDQSGPSDRYGVITGVLSADLPSDSPQRLVSLARQFCVGDTVDGGVSCWMQRFNGDGKDIPRREGMYTSAELPHDWPGTKLPEARWKSEVQGDIPIRCHCRGVNLVFRRGLADAEFADKDPAELPRFVDPVSRKHVVKTDACDSCRTMIGADFVYWMFSFLRHIGFAQSAKDETQSTQDSFPSTLADLYAAITAPPAQRDPRLGTLNVFCSSEGVRRYSCSRCAACIFYSADAKRDLVDIAMGVVGDNSPERGVRQEGSFLWLLGGHVTHRQDVLGTWREEWLNAIEMESEAWRVERRFPEWWKLSKQHPGSSTVNSQGPA